MIRGIKTMLSGYLSLCNKYPKVWWLKQQFVIFSMVLRVDCAQLAGSLLGISHAVVVS